jgi:hypothetical protein
MVAKMTAAVKHPRVLAICQSAYSCQPYGMAEAQHNKQTNAFRKGWQPAADQSKFSFNHTVLFCPKC